MKLFTVNNECDTPNCPLCSSEATCSYCGDPIDAEEAMFGHRHCLLRHGAQHGSDAKGGQKNSSTVLTRAKKSKTFSSSTKK